MARLPLALRLTKLDLECELEALLERQAEIELSLALLARLATTHQEPTP